MFNYVKYRTIRSLEFINLLQIILEGVTHFDKTFFFRSKLITLHVIHVTRYNSFTNEFKHKQVMNLVYKVN